MGGDLLDYHPKLKSIDLVWSKLESLLKAFGARDLQALAAALKYTRVLLTPSDLASWFAPCGYDPLAQRV